MRSFHRGVLPLLLVTTWGCGTTGGTGAGDMDSGTASDGGDDGGGLVVQSDAPSACLKTCADLGKNCGPVGDGCGGLMDCGTCTSPETCGASQPSVCGSGTCTTKKTCADLGATCGMQGDGCGGLMDCGACTAPATCGGGGVANTCGTASIGADGGTCVPKTCAAMGYDCGPVADGCGGLVDCGKCAAGSACGAGGKPNVCSGGPSGCVKKTCADYGADCGPVSDGCGGLTASCGTCTGGNVCGFGMPSKCGGAPPPCTPKTCAAFPGTCGAQPDGCGGLTASCGTCAAPQTCGGGGVASVCGGGPKPCTPKTCADYPAGTCGRVADGCGGLTPNCGTCAAPQICGGGGVPSQCGGGPAPCTPKTCASLPAGTCGQVADGCGGLTANCGSCAAPQICGGGGVPSQCGGGGGTSCVNLQCKQVTCAGGATTSLSGTVYDPAGLHPLPNVNVYVPNGTVAPLTSGASCDACSSGLSGIPLVRTTTDVNGNFKLVNVPVDVNVPVVIQLGKWRRKISVTTSKCGDVAIGAGLTRLPRNQSEGDIPKIALATGGADALECLLRKIGIDDAEFTDPTGTGRVNLYASSVNGGGTNQYSPTLGGGVFPDATQLWSSFAPNLAVSPNLYGLGGYDVVLLGCEGTDTTSNKNNASLQAMQDYANAGGRVFGEHYHYAWMRHANALPAPYAGWAGLVTWNTTFTPLNNPTDETVLTGFPKGLMMNQWMQSPAILAATVVPPAPSPSRFPVNDGRASIAKINDTTNTLLWIQTIGATGAPGSPTPIPQYFSFDTPVGKVPACGRFVFSDIHVSSGDSPGAGLFPFDPAAPTDPASSVCVTPKTSMTPQELALEFMFFDLASPVCGGSVPPPTCTPQTCASQGIACGPAPDGCGGVIASCGTCAAPAVCGTGGKCAASSCTPTTCAALGYACGSWPDGCGGALNCGACTAPATCGGGGVTGKCGGSTCTPTTCAALGHNCGSWADGCGGTLNCGACTAPATCGGTGTPGTCGGSTCTPTTCAALGHNCGAWADGCGGALNCGTCAAPTTCGGGGVPGLCGGTGCTPKTCAQLGITCGPSGDGCGGAIDCGPCPPPTPCVPLACGGRCGPQGDGCGGIVSCPACPGACVPTTCTAAGAECGDFPNGCGGLLHCGTCVAPATCGGGGTPNKCGTIR
jgi:hypothetical protein